MNKDLDLKLNRAISPVKQNERVKRQPAIMKDRSPQIDQKSKLCAVSGSVK